MDMKIPILMFVLLMMYVLNTQETFGYYDNTLSPANYIPDDVYLPDMYTKNTVVSNKVTPVKYEDPFEEVKTLYGHSKMPYTTGQTHLPATIYPTKRQIDTVSGNHWLPVMQPPSDTFAHEPIPLNTEEILQRDNRNIKNSGIHPLNDVRFLIEP